MVLPSPKVNDLVELLRWRAQQQPTKIAYTFLVDGETDEVHLTYAELDQQARAIATRLQALATVGERVMLLYPPGLAFLHGFFGCLYAGMIAVPAYPPHAKRPLPRLHAIVRDAQPKVALLTQDIEEKVSAQFADYTDESAIHVLATDTMTDIMLAEQADQWQAPAINADDLAFLQYTSGSTGNAKGVMVSHGNVLHNERMMASAFQNNEASVGVSWIPLFHDMGLIGSVLQPLYLGVPTIFMSPVAFLQKPIRWLQAISRYQATGTSAPTFGYDLCVQMIKPEQCNDLDLSHWRLAVAGAEPVRAETMQRFTERFAPYGFRSETFYPSYGLAEATLFVTGGLPTEPPVLRQIDKMALETQHLVQPPTGNTYTVVSCGRSWLDQQVIIVNPDTLIRCLEGQVGEIWVAGPSVAQGYWQQPAATVETFQAHVKATGEGPFLRTGDLGFLQGTELFVTGRLKDLIIIRGRNHYPQDIEQTVEKSHEALQAGAGAAFSVEIKGEERLVVIQEVKRTHLRNLNIDEIVGNIRQAVTQEYQLQVYATLLLKPGTLPKTSSGKIQRRACRDGFLMNTLTTINEPVPVKVQTTVAEQPAPRAEAKPSQPIRTATPIRRMDLEREAVLDPTLTFDSAMLKAHKPSVSKAIFLTGATGFLGVYLLSELLQKTQATIYCLVRAADAEAGMGRLQRKLAANSMWQEKFRSRIMPVIGDLAEPLFGLTPAEFQQLAEQVDTIYHNGAIVNFVQPYSALKAPNVDGTQEIIRLATQSKIKPLHYISTVFVFGARKHFDGRIIYEDDDLDESEELLLGYFQSKWVAEKILAMARERGLPVFVYRPGLIIGDSQTGIWDNTDDFLCRIIKGCIQLGIWPTLEAAWDLAPVDYVSKAIVHLALQQESPTLASTKTAFHLINSSSLHFSELFNWIQMFGYPIQEVPLRDWQVKLTAQRAKIQANALAGLTLLLARRRSSTEHLTLPELFEHGRAPQFDCQNTLESLSGTPIACPPIDQKQFSQFLAYFIQIGFLEAPPKPLADLQDSLAQPPTRLPTTDNETR
ncbi:hypothetical protein BH10CHL1_BH10CHL1_06680 [soil metagenome]